MVHPSIATTQVAVEAPIPLDALPAIEMAKKDTRPDRAPCLRPFSLRVAPKSSWEKELHSTS